MKKEKIEQKLIDFEGGQLLGVKTEDGKIFLGVKKACMDIGLTDGQSRRQVENLQEDLVLNQGIANLRLPTNGGEQEVLVINEEFVPLWFAKISITPKMKKDTPLVVNKLIAYQLKASKVLHNAFMATEESKQEFYNDLGLKGEIITLQNKVDNMEQTMGALIGSATINSYQAKQLNKAVRDKVNTLLGGAHSKLYSEKGRMYLKNLWLNLTDKFSVSEYRDLNPLNYNEAFDFVHNWSWNS